MPKTGDAEAQSGPSSRETVAPNSVFFLALHICSCGVLKGCSFRRACEDLHGCLPGFRQSLKFFGVAWYLWVSAWRLPCPSMARIRVPTFWFGPLLDFPHFGNRNSGQLRYNLAVLGAGLSCIAHKRYGTINIRDSRAMLRKVVGVPVVSRV